jgi:hypothetical protein
MDEKVKVEAYISLYKQQMDRFSKTQDVEWKGNFGVWALLAGAIYFASGKDGISISLIWVAAILTVLFFVHLGWVFTVHSSERDDKERWDRYRGKALDILWPGHGEEPFKYSRWKEVWWLLLEGGMTLLLCTALFAILYWRLG